MVNVRVIANTEKERYADVEELTESSEFVDSLLSTPQTSQQSISKVLNSNSALQDEARIP